MYEELVKALRDMSQMGMKYGIAVVKMREAADAIEELQQIVNHYEEESKGWWLAACEAKEKIAELSKPRWIPVTEQKPKTDDIVIVAIHDDSGDTPYDVTSVGFYLDVFPLGIWVVENERCNYVTHWMPLPSTEGLNET